MRKSVTFLVLGLAAISLVACSNKQGKETVSNSETAHIGPVELKVTTTWGGNDGNRQAYLEAITIWQKSTGNIINDASGKPDEVFKTRVITDFEVGAEPDVLFYFTGSDADPLVLADKVVSLEEIREIYPDYGTNMKEELIQTSPADGKQYSIPAFGYWEAMYVNKLVLKKAGVEIPGEDYTWEQFLKDCEKIKESGNYPIAAALGDIPHYWFEFCIYNQLSPLTHSKLPSSCEDENGQAWINGLSDIKYLFEQGYFPINTSSATDDETFQMFLDGKAAFLIDGSWKAGVIEEKADNADNFTVTYVPGKGERKATDIIAGLSNGYYITRKAWDDPEKRETAVQFINYMTSDSVVSNMATISVAALKNGVIIDETQLSNLQKDCLKMTKGVTAIAAAVQDSIPADCRVPIFKGMPRIVTGQKEIEDAVEEVLRLIEAEKK